MSPSAELAVTLSAELYDHLSAEATRLGLSLEWLVAALVVDTVEEERVELASA